MVSFDLPTGLANTLLIMLIVYLIFINVTAVILCVSDKKKARRHRHRIPESVLITVSILGGSVCMFITMLIIRHKTRKVKFMLGIPAIIILQAAAVFLLVH